MVDEEKDYLESEDIVIEDVDSGIETIQTIEYITIEEPEETVVEIEEAFSSLGQTNDLLRHDLLNNRDLPDQHTVEAITGLKSTLKDLSSVKNMYATSGGLAEFRRWSDDNPDGENRTGYFVSIINNDGDITICNKNYPDVYGVTVAQSGFCGYQNVDYAYLTLDKDQININTANNWKYAKVCLVGDVRVRVAPDSGIYVGDYVLPGNNGYAVKSTNGIGFRVSSINNGTLTNANGVETMANFVTISLVPQNDNIARVMSELSVTNGNIGGIQIEIDNIKDQIGDITTGIKGDIDNILGEIDGIGGTVEDLFTGFDEVKDTAQNAKDEAIKATNEIKTTYADAVNRANEAKNLANSALTQINELDITVTENGTDISSIQKNTDAIQHLVAHVDKYNVGKYSPSYGITYEEASNILWADHIYVATNNHTEVCIDENGVEHKYNFMTFNDVGVGNSYKWMKDGDSLGWQFYSYVYTNSDSAPSGLIEYDLWYCWQEVPGYEEGVLYHWNGTQWVKVASVNDDVRSIGLLRQTADELTTTYTRLEGDMSNITQTVDKISTVVLNVDGQGSTLEQAADKIIAGTFNPEESSALSLLLGYGFNAISEGKYHTLINTYVDSPNAEAVRYSQAPTWDESLGGFVFKDGYQDDDGKYFIYPNDSTKYCKETMDGYEIYTIGNISTSNIGQRISESRSELESWTMFKKGINETSTIINQESDENGASIATAVYGDFRYCVEIRTDLTAEEISVIKAAVKYIEKPIYENKKFTFKEQSPSVDGIYYFIDDQFYGKIITNNGEIIGYEKYGMKISSRTSIMQEIDENGAAIALTVGNGNVEGGLFAKAINDSTYAGIVANKILLQTEGGEVTFADILNPGTTTICGDYIKSGVLVSNNYEGPKTYRKFGVKIGEATKLTGDSFNFVSGVRAYDTPEDARYVLPDGYGYLGMDLEIDTGEYYCFYNNTIYTIAVEKRSQRGMEAVFWDEYIYLLNDLPIPDGTEITAYADQEPSKGIVAGEATDYIHYAIVTEGARYRTDFLRDDTYYYGDSINTNTLLTKVKIRDISTSKYTGYLICDEDFSLIPSVIESSGGGFRYCVEIKTSLTESEVSELSKAKKYIRKPSYKDGKFIFEEKYESASGSYYSIDDQFYGKIITNEDDEIVGYEKYGMKTSYGLRLDLNEGTIISKNLILDNTGNLTITGKITAESGYIGDKKNGFEIVNMENPAWIYVVDDPITVEKGKVLECYFEYESGYHYFVLDEGTKLSRGDKIVYYPEAGSIYINGTYIGRDYNISNIMPSDGLYLGYRQKHMYYLSNNQDMLIGSEDGKGNLVTGEPGVYIGPDGIGLGNGNFFVDADGNVKLSGSIQWGSNTSPEEVEASATAAMTKIVNGTYPNGTFIDRNMIKSGIFIATGEGAKTRGSETIDEAAYYICNGLTDGKPNVVGFLSFDGNGKGTDESSENRVLLTTEQGVSLKLQTYCDSGNEFGVGTGNISITAGVYETYDHEEICSGDAYVYFGSNVIFGSTLTGTSEPNKVTFNPGCIVDFTDTKVKGLDIDTVAKFAEDTK